MKTLLLPWLLALSATAAPILPEASPQRAVSTTCPSYTIINTRGTSEPQGPSAGFLTMNALITAQLPGGTIYNTVYPADASQISTLGTLDILREITSTLRASPDECFLLQGYSQGAAATVNALPRITGASFDAVKGVFLIGDPEHRGGLACNVDNDGGTTTRDVSGLEALVTSGIPSNWVSKTLDVCIYGDGVCDTTHGVGITPQHLEYPTDDDTQELGTLFGLAQLGA
ncbi:A cutinase-like protein from cryptococcus Sp [Xylaria sp. CBS 124048]|nr:A cutinase-like protein from cryptococcus Sp [Xylaria sp. CBS 124048]